MKLFGATMTTKGRRLVSQQACATKDPILRHLVSAIMRSTRPLLIEVEKLDRIAARLAKDDAVCQRLMTVPGVGPITALTFRAAIDDPSRFTTSRAVGAYFGLTPRLLQSGRMNYSGRITRRGDTAGRTALYTAARTMMVCCKSSSRLRRWALRLAKRRGFKVAAVALARRLAVELHRMWVSGRDFDPERSPRGVGRSPRRGRR
jgi:transposase